MKLTLPLIFFSTTWAFFNANVRIDHENRDNRACLHTAITTGPAISSIPPVYVVFQKDLLKFFLTERSDIYFQKSTDGGVTFMPQDILIRRGQYLACYPDITTDRNGNIYVVYTERLYGSNLGHIYCSNSSDQGNTWSNPVQIDDNSTPVGIGWVRIVIDSAGKLFTVWNDSRLTYFRIWSSVSTDNGLTWRQNIRVDDDTISDDLFHADVAVQPGSNYYLVTGAKPFYYAPQYITYNSFFTISTDQGLTFSPTFVLDTFSGYCGQPHIVADENYLICDYTGSSGEFQNTTESRTSTDFGLTWSTPVPVTQLGSNYSSYLNGGKLAIDPLGRIHTALMVCDLITFNYEIYYALSANHGFSWSPRFIVNDIPVKYQGDPDIAADNNGYAYITWQDCHNKRNEIWFATNRPLAIAEQNSNPLNPFIRCSPTVFRDKTLFQIPNSINEITTIYLYNSVGVIVRKLTLKPKTNMIIWNGSDNSGHRCPPGIYIIKAERNGIKIASTKVVLLP